ncbi:uncharacterized protein DNG_00277 [Cephalotrichum gorgonifer]|uniref:C2H2-type domain-containing protein n=1 Tax=Cephalotrichum gorgonifer TaxID=2041049 RepID=A0AAE8MQC6_9PEZI|nr:uncharacterized protein DNG_00277 [Cephalotrichum gorgonifer]
MNNADYYTSDPTSATSHDHEPGLVDYNQVNAPQERPASPSQSSFDFQTQLSGLSYADQGGADSTFVNSPYSPYAQSNFFQTIDPQQAMSSWSQQGNDVSASPSDTAAATAMNPSHLFFPMGDADSVFPRYIPMEGDAAYLDRCTSPCAESCESQCGEDGDADVCCDPNCEDVADLCTEFCTDADCVDQVKCSSNICPITGLSSPDEDAAATLASIGTSDPSTSPRADGDLSAQTESSLRLSVPTSPQDSFITSPPMSGHYTGAFPNLFPHQPMTMGFYPTLPGDFGVNLDLVDDLIMHHNPQQPSHQVPHFRPCPLDNAPLLTRRCRLPRSVYDGVGAQPLHQMAGTNNYGLLPDSCGVYLSGPDDVLPHIASNHPQQYMTLQSYFDTNAAAPRINETNKMALLSAMEAMGPPNPVDGGAAALFDPYNTTPSSTPHDSATPQTQGSDATHDTVDATPQFSCKWLEDSGAVCGLQFDDSERLHQHVITHSRSLKKIEAGHRCRWAGCTRPEGPKGCFPQRTKLERHLQTHTGYKPAECKICGLALSGVQALAQHMRTHTNETPWKCPFPGCGKEFKQQSALTMHTRTHTDEKPLSCDICGKRFSESSNLSKHKKIHSRSFKCVVCGKDFSRADQLRKHEKLHDVASAAAGDGALLSKTYDGRVTKVKGKA